MARAEGIAAGLLAGAIWGGMYAVSKVVLTVIPPFSLLSLRLILAVLALSAIMAVKRQPVGQARQVAALLAVGAVGFGISLGLQFVGTQLSTASNAALVTSASPVFMVVFAGWLLGERAGMRRILALAVAIAGVVAIIDPRTFSLSASTAVGNLALFGAAVSWGLYSVLAKRASRSGGELRVNLLSSAGGLLLALPLASVEPDSVSMERLNLGIWLGVLYLGLISTALALSLWTRALARLEAGEASLLFFSQPVVGVGLGAWLLGDRLGANFWLGAFGIGLGLILAVSESKSANFAPRADTYPQPSEIREQDHG